MSPTWYIGLTGDHDIPEASTSERRHDWSGLRLESILHHDQTGQPQTTFHHLPARARTHLAAPVTPIAPVAAMYDLASLADFSGGNIAQNLCRFFFISFKTVPPFYPQNIDENLGLS